MLWIGWAVACVGIYYTPLWRLIGQGPTAWGAFARAAGDSLAPVFLLGAVLLGAVRGAPWLRRLLPPPGARRPGVFVAGAALLILIAAVGTGARLLALAPAYGFPAAGEAFDRAARALSGAGLVLLAAHALGAAGTRVMRWRFAGRAEALLFESGTGLGVLAYLLLGVAALGRYDPRTIWAVVGALALTGAIRLGRRAVAGRHASLPPSEGTGRRAGVWGVLVLVAAATALLAALAPEIEYDALWYHLGFPRIWLEQGRVVDFPTEYVSLYPMTWELLFGAGLALGGSVAAKLLHYAAFLLVALLTYQTAARFAPRASPWLAAALLVTMPTVLWEATTAYVDLAVALHVGLAGYAALRFTESRSRRWGILAALNLGFALATKHLALFALLLLPLGVAAGLWRRAGRAGPALAAGLVLAAAALLVPLPWYIRSWVASGDPVFPELFGILGAPAERWDAVSDAGLRAFEGRFGPSRTPLALLLLPWDVTMHAARYGGALGPAPLFLIPALILLRRSRSLFWLGAFAILYTALWASPWSSFQLRFLIPVAPVLAVLAAEGYGRLRPLLRSTVPAGGRMLAAGTGLLLFFNLPFAVALHERDRSGWTGWLTHVLRRVPAGVVAGRRSADRYLRLTVPSYGAWQHINAHLPAEARILTFSGGDDFYGRRERLWSDATVARPAVWDAPRGREQQALDALRDLGITHILLDKTRLQALAPGTLAVADPANVGRWYVREYEDGRFVLYRIRWEDLR